MIDKQDFYHGAAIVRLLNDSRCRTMSKDPLGYIVNDSMRVIIKYTTRKGTPWRYTFNHAEFEELAHVAQSYQRTVLVFVNGGDGIAALQLSELRYILGNEAGWVSMARRFHEQYTVAGSCARLVYKVSPSRWPGLLFN